MSDTTAHLPKYRPILFSGSMVRAILEGRKTQTRRQVKVRKRTDPRTSAVCYVWEPYPYGKPGDRLWVRETFAYTDGAINDQPGYVYRATDPDWSEMEGFKWKPSIFMPRAASRITLEITAVRAERLHNITEADAKAEGAQRGILCNDEGLLSLHSTMDEGDEKQASHRDGFTFLWQTINNNWNTNPLVWVLTFKKI